MWELLPCHRCTDRVEIETMGVNLTTSFLPQERWSCRNKMRRLDVTTTSHPQKHWSCRNTKEGGECDNYFPPVGTIETRELNLTTTCLPQEYLSCRNKMRRLNVTTTSLPQKHWSCRNTNEGVECDNYFTPTRALIVPKYKRGGWIWRLLRSPRNTDPAEIQMFRVEPTYFISAQVHWVKRGETITLVV